MKHCNRILTLGFACILAFILSIPVYAASTMKNDNHTDTEDYCLRAHDITIGISELKDKDEDERNSFIYDAADISILIRSSSETSEKWTKLTRDQMTIDFSKVEETVCDEGYPVVVAAPPINLESGSSITFKVFVVDDYPKTATVHFTGTDIEDLDIELTDGNKKVSLSDFQLPVKDGYQFKGWYLDKELKQPFLIPDDPDYENGVVTSSLVLYPKWEVIETPIDTPTPTDTPAPTDTPMPTDTPTPTNTPTPIDIPAPTDTPITTDAPLQAETPSPTDEIKDTQASVETEEKTALICELPVFLTLKVGF